MIHGKIRNGTEIQVKCQEYNYSNWSISCSVLRCSFSIFNWRIEEIRKIDTKTRNVLTLYKMHHPKADIDRLFVKRTEGRRGPLQIKATYKAEIINIAEYLNTNVWKTSKYVNL